MNKIVLLGPTGAGKTELYYCLIGEERTEFKSNIGTTNQKVEINGEYYWIYDTAGQQRFQDIAFNYVRDANVAILITDGSSKQFDDVSTQYYKKILDTSENIKIINVMNKLDLLTPDKENEANKRAEAIAPSEKYFLISALNKENIECLKSEIIKKCKEFNSEKKPGPKTVSIRQSNEPSKGKGSCC